jgi:hypothetical protein
MLLEMTEQMSDEQITACALKYLDALPKQPTSTPDGLSQQLSNLMAQGTAP